MKSLSTQIFECCGGEPRKEIYCNSCPKHHCSKYFIDKCTLGENVEMQIKEHFPDLETNANNFVRLYELKTGLGKHDVMDFKKNSYTVSELVSFYNHTPSNRRNFLLALHDILTDEGSSIEDVEAVKQAIANEQWEW